jgi:hypothetical protein
MNNADLANERAFAEVKRLCLMGLDSTTLRQRVTERLGRAVPFEAYAACSAGHFRPVDAEVMA